MFNLFVVLFATFVIAFVLIFFIARHDLARKKRSSSSLRDGSAPVTDADFRLFTKFLSDLCEYLKLEVVEMTRPEEFEIVIRAVNANPITRVEYLVVGFYAPESQEIERVKITEVSEQIVSERISKGILVTPGSFPAEVKNLPELAPLEFIDGVKMAEIKGKMIL
jgi:hypothetical protein